MKILINTLKMPVACFSLFLILCSYAGALNTSVKPAIKSSNTFAIDAYGQLAEKNGNIIFSPLSIFNVYCIACNGAEGTTRLQLEKALHADTGMSVINGSYAKLREHLSVLVKQSSVNVYSANGLWIQNGHISTHFLSDVSNYYGARVFEVDFISSPASAVTRINNWVARKTKNKLQKIIDGLNDDTRMITVNAIYFKAFWHNQFKRSDTKQEQFWTSLKENKKIPMMNIVDSFRYAENDTLRMLEMPYAGEKLAMLVLLPQQQNCLRSIEKQLTYSDIISLNSKLKNISVNVSLPRFTCSYDINCKSLLQQLGITNAFIKGSADFSKINGSNTLYIGCSIQKAGIIVNEEGSEAWAATSADFDFLGEPAGSVTFNANHPFMYIIIDRIKGTILFIGRFSDPE